MTCDQAIELLPWLLNGTLEDQERNELRRHLETCESCRQALAETREAGRMFDQHIPTAAMVALAWGEEPPGLDRDTVERHLESCPQCSAELELARTSRRLEEADNLAIFPSARPAGQVRRAGGWRLSAMAAGMTGLIAASGWFYSAQQASELSARLAEREQRPPVVRSTPAPAERQELARMKAELEGLQASHKELAGEAEKARTQLAQMENAPRGLVKPVLNAWVNPVDTGDVTRGGAAQEVVIPSRQVATPLLAADPDVRTPEREIEIRDARGTILLREEGLRRSRDDDYSITFPPDFFKPGLYTIQLYSKENGKRVPRETYKIRVE